MRPAGFLLPTVAALVLAACAARPRHHRHPLALRFRPLLRRCKLHPHRRPLRWRWP